MKIINLKQKYLFVYSFQDIGSAFAVKIQDAGQVWLLNCSEGCQNILARKKIKISQITKIIITDLKIQNVSGLMGLLSSLSLNTVIKTIDLYGPKGLAEYLYLGRKYSQTNFRYALSIYRIETGLIIINNFYRMYAFKKLNTLFIYSYSILTSERPGHFNLLQATNFQLPLGPLFGNLKLGKDFILPDGTIIYGNKFVDNYYLGNKISFFSDSIERCSLENINNGNFILMI